MGSKFPTAKVKLEIISFTNCFSLVSTYLLQPTSEQQLDLNTSGVITNTNFPLPSPDKINKLTTLR